MAKTTISVEKSTRDRLAEVRGDEYKNWDAFLNEMADKLEEEAAAPRETTNETEQFNDSNAGRTGDEGEKIDRVIARIDDLEAELPRKIAEELRQ